MDERELHFVQVDVFAKKPLQGNPLAVFLDSRRLNEKEMQAIAREMNLSETTFVFPRDESIEQEKGIRVRIFTTTEELPFAGHPTLGTAWVLKKNDRNSIVLDLNSGAIPVNFSNNEGDIFGEMMQREPQWGSTHNIAKAASALGVEESDLARVETISTGVPFAIAEFTSLDKLRSLRPDYTDMENYLKTTDAKFFYLVSTETENPAARLHARMIFYAGEDPATGSAAGPASAWMVKHKITQPEELVWIEQGIEASRPSQIFVRAGGSQKNPTNVRVGGFCAGLIKGELTLPE